MESGQASPDPVEGGQAALKEESSFWGMREFWVRWSHRGGSTRFCESQFQTWVLADSLKSGYRHISVNHRFVFL